MYSTVIYHYQQLTRVLTVDTDGEYFIYRYNPVYAKTLTINKGVDNVLLFELINQDQKPVNIQGSEFVFRLIDQTGTIQLFEAAAVSIGDAQGRIKVVINAADTLPWIAQPASYSLQRRSGNYTQAVYVSADSQARGQCNIVDSVRPELVPATETTVPDLTGKNEYMGVTPTGWPDWARTPAPINTVSQTEFYSSHMPSRGGNFTTIQFDLEQFTGTLKVQAAENYQSVWYDVSDSVQYLGANGSRYINVPGFYPLLRLAINTAQGRGAAATVTVENNTVTGLEVVAAGSGYLAPPLVEILGNGSGAQVTAELESGAVTGFEIISGGSGYTPFQYSGAVSAQASITTGKIKNIRYR